MSHSFVYGISGNLQLSYLVLTLIHALSSDVQEIRNSDCKYVCVYLLVNAKLMGYVHCKKPWTVKICECEIFAAVIKRSYR